MEPESTQARTPTDAVTSIYEILQNYDEATRTRILASVMTLMGTPAPTIGAAMPGGPARKLSPMELVQAKEPATNAQRIMVFAYYREKYEGINYFSRADLEAYFEKAKLAPPENFARDFREAVKQGWLYENGSESYLTGKGLETVETGFGGRALPRGRGSKRKGQKPKQKRT
jgi:hypothetical protein